MSQITCCPACGTMFRVVADQLRISEGWVRCGHCAEVFDATAQMQDGAAADVSDTQIAPETEAEAEAEIETRTETASEFVDSRDAAEPDDGAERGPAGVHDGMVQPTASVSSDGPREGQKSLDRSDEVEGVQSSTETPGRPPDTQEPSTTEAVPARFQPSLVAADAHRASGPTATARTVREDEDDDAGSSEVASGWSRGDAERGYPPIELRRADRDDDETEDFFTPPDVNSGWTAPDAPNEEQTSQDVSFIRDARRREFWRRPLVRLAGVAVAVLLLMALVAQYAVHDRNRLASVHPQLRPVLAALCQPLGCGIGPLQRIDAVAIDSSAFTKLRPDVFRLSVSLKNQGAAAVAMPALELTLTDASDQPVLRRVLAPRELGATSAVLAGNGEWSGVVSLTIAANGNAERVAGYRLLAFYP